MNKPMIRKPLAFIDLAKQRARIGQNVDQAIQRVLAHGNYIMGPEVRELEVALSNFCIDSVSVCAQISHRNAFGLSAGWCRDDHSRSVC